MINDFHQDPETRPLQPKLKIAALLWGCLRHSAGENVYHNTLLHQYKEEIQQLMDEN